MAKLNVNNTEIRVLVSNETDFICLTDMTSSFTEGSGLIGKWVTNKNTLEYLGIWEKINNPNFNYPEFGVIEQNAGTNRFIMSVGQWIDRTKAYGLKVKAKAYHNVLHGNAKKKETAPDGGKDENVFDIMQGVSINIFVKKRG